MSVTGRRETTVAGALLIDLVRYLERTGIPGEVTCRAVGIEGGVPGDAHARLPGSLMERMWEQAELLTGDPDLGLHTAENFNPGALNLLGYVLLSCRSAREALGRAAQYAALLNDGLTVRVTEQGAVTHCFFETVAGMDNYVERVPRQVMETMACGALVTLRRLTTRDIQPLRVAFRHPEPAEVAEHLRIFGSVAFSQTHNVMEFRTADLTGDLLSANPALLAIFDAQARQLLIQMEQSDRACERGPMSRRVLNLLARRITVAVPSLEEIASELAVSERSLQRELRLEKTSFRQLIEDTRKGIALQHLAQPGTSASEAAFLLGFSEPSAFSRAFRRWTGSAPTQFQAA